MDIDREDRIRRRAHEIWEREGQPSGRDHEHWERAGREIDDEDRGVAPNPASETEGNPPGENEELTDKEGPAEDRSNASRHQGSRLRSKR